MTDLEQRIRQLREQEAQATAKKARAEHEQAVAEQQRDAALRALEDEFGITSIEKARELLEQTETDLAAEADKIEKALAQAAGEGPE